MNTTFANNMRIEICLLKKKRRAIEKARRAIKNKLKMNKNKIKYKWIQE